MRVDAIGAGTHIWISPRLRATRNSEYINNITIQENKPAQVKNNHFRSPVSDDTGDFLDRKIKGYGPSGFYVDMWA
jgi:hypothetical protein